MHRDIPVSGLNRLTYRTVVVVFVAIFATALTTACKDDSQDFARIDTERESINHDIQSIKSPDSLRTLIAQYEKENKLLYQTLLYQQLGRVLRDQSQFADAIIAHQQAIGLAEMHNDTVEIIMAYNNIATNYRRMGVLDEATNYHMRAFALNESFHDYDDSRKLKNRVRSLNGLGNVYLEMGSLNEADSVLRQALEGEKRLNSMLGQAINYANLGSIKRTLNQTDSAWVYFRKSLEMNQLAESQIGIALCHSRFGELYENEQRYSKAIEEYLLAYDLMKSTTDEWHCLETEINLARVYITLSDFSSANARLNEAMQTASKIGSISHRATIYELMYQMNRRLGNTEQALRNYVAAKELNDSIIDLDKLNKIQNMRLSLERDRQHQKVALVQENLRQEKSLRTATFTVAVLLVTLALALVAFLLYHIRTRTRAAKAERHIQHIRNAFFASITEQLNTPIQEIQQLARQLYDDDDSENEEVRKTARLISGHGNSMTNLIKQLIDVSEVRSQSGESRWRHGNIVDFVTAIVDELRPKAKAKHQDLSISYSAKEIDTDFVPEYVERTVKKLVNNAIKHTDERGRINVTIEKLPRGRMRIVVYDTGHGISEEALKHIFEPIVRSVDAKNEATVSMGLSIAKMMMEAMNGKITAESKVGQGSTFAIQLPVTHRVRATIDKDNGNS